MDNIIIIILIAVIFAGAAFVLGKALGKKAESLKSLEAENRLRKRYEEIDNEPDLDNPIDHL